ncbi:hypothetical protein TNCT_204701 [Trichonephila clavata]|uniref:Uncharacterized protein n=1 Tax=Trichonephila clavata TaxID=2740835 RepID=A0A8X6LAZ5_TRICU|nr:hypothetical protein TNCT_204701 [Trichonephila clavata]
METLSFQVSVTGFSSKIISSMVVKAIFLSASLMTIQACSIVNILVNAEISASSIRSDVLGNYAFQNDIVDKLGPSNYRTERRDAHRNKKRSFIINGIDGWATGINNGAAGRGFQVSIKTNEPGYTTKAPSISFKDTGMNTPVINSAAPPTEVVGHASPVAISVAYYGAITNDAGPDLRYRTKKVLIENDFV